MVLGNIILENINDENIETMFLDLDFKDRTLLKIITENGFGPLFASSKVNILLNEIWAGKKTYECDGGMEDFS